MSSNRFASYCFLSRCTFYKNNHDCPFTELRELTIEERVRLLKKMTHQEITNFEFIHKKCLKEKTFIMGNNLQ